MALPGMTGIRGGKEPLKVTYRGKLTSANSSENLFSMGTVNIGSPPAGDRVVAVVIPWGRSAGTGNIVLENDCTIQGILATTLPAPANDFRSKCNIIYAVVPSGDTAEIMLNYSWTYHSRQNAYVFTIENPESVVPVVSDVSETTSTIVSIAAAFPADSAIIAGWTGYGTNTPAWAGAIDVEGAYTAGDNLYFAAAMGAGPQSAVSVSSVNARVALYAAAWK